MPVPHTRRAVLAKASARFVDHQVAESYCPAKGDVVPAAGPRKESPTHG